MSKQQRHFTIHIPRIPEVDFSNVHDPVLENPLDTEMEGLISVVGERRYLKALVERFGIIMNISPDELTDHECRKMIRALMRNAVDYEGPEMEQ